MSSARGPCCSNICSQAARECEAQSLLRHTGKKEVCIVGIEVWAILELKWVSHDNSQVLIVVAVIVNQDRRGICFE
jgi:hypothetical protein